MTDGLQVFSCPEFGSVRSVKINGEPWFVASDLCNALCIRNSRDATSKLDDDEKADVGLTDTSSSGVTQSRTFTIVNEPGMYTLVLGSRKPEAKAFKRWITHTILPALRKDGSYTMRQEEPLMLEEADDLPQRTVTPDDYLTATRILSTCRNERLPYALSCLRHAGIDLQELTANVPQPLKPKRTTWEKQRVSRLVRIALQDYGYTVRGLARRLNVTPQCIVFYRDGERCPSPRHEFELVELLRQIIPVDELEARMDEDEAVVS